MKYSDFNLVANPSGQGYIQEGTSVFYIDEVSTTKVDLGTIIPTDKYGYVCAYVSGVRPQDLEVGGFKGAMQADYILIDGDLVTGSTLKEATTLPWIQLATASLTTQHYDFTDVDNPAPLLLNIEDFVPNDKDQLFTEKDESGTIIKMGLYSEPMTEEPCATKISNFFNT